MKVWYLILVISGSHGGGIGQSGPFYDQQSCKLAKTIAEEELGTWVNRVRGVCVPSWNLEE